ncbi:MAG: TRZ/ATZ family protein [Clostridiaceae bacterium]|jgi:fumarate hydratase subunit beta|nr:TRZ/ATZ family protein [Clostridiaceae bacterium]
MDRNEEVRRVTLPLTKEMATSFRMGERVLLTGPMYTLRDAGHQRLVALLERGEESPFPLEGAVIFYVGPTPPLPGYAMGSAGPTTSYRMDPYAPALISRGLGGMIGKGRRSPEVINAMRRYGCVYFAATGGAGALLSHSIESSEVICWEDLGTEALRLIRVRDFPVTVAIDTDGSDLYEEGPAGWRVMHDVDADDIIAGK